MALVSGVISNLVGGVSQQPPQLRLSSACTAMENAWPSLVSGLQKRPATSHIVNLSSLSLPTGTKGHLIDRNDTYRYLVLFKTGDVKVINLLTGATEPVSFPDGTNYLTSGGTGGSMTALDTIRCHTVGDYTFVANNTVRVDTDAVSEPAVTGQTRNNPAGQATCYVTQSIANHYYSIYINGTLVASYLTPDGTTGATAVPDTATIAQNLQAGLTSHGYTWIRTGSTITITNFPSGGTLSTQGGSGDKAIKCFIDAVQSFSDLPPNSPQGRMVKVIGDPDTAGDDYYVVYQGTLWIETVAYGQGEAFDATTMPHVLVNNNDGTWTFKKHTWKGRIAGNSESSQNPSFVTSNISDVFVYTNRLGFLADENVIFSEANVFENFYRTTVAQLLDSDPIDVAALSSNVNYLKHAVPFNKNLLVISNLNQFSVEYNNYLAPKTIQVRYTASFPVSSRLKPVPMGNSLYMVDDRPDYQFTKINEFYTKEVGTLQEAEEVTSSVPEYIPKDLVWITGSNRSKTVLVNSSQDPSTIYLYKFFWVGDRKVQNAWSKWTFNDCTSILWAGFSGAWLYLLMNRSDGINLERIYIDEEVFDTAQNFPFLIDRQHTVPSGSIAYNATTGKSTVTLGIHTTGPVEILSNDTTNNIYGIRHTVTSVNSNTVTVDGDIRSHQVKAGLGYTQHFEFSTLFAKERRSAGGETSVLDGRFQVRYLTVSYNNTCYFKTRVTLTGRDPYEHEFVGRFIGGDSSVLGGVPFSTGKYRIPVMSENTKARVEMFNDSPYPSSFGNCEWQGQLSPKSVQRV